MPAHGSTWLKLKVSHGRRVGRDQRSSCPPLPSRNRETEAQEIELNGLPKVEEMCDKNQVSGRLLVTLSTYQTKANQTRPDQTIPG